jgi:hypothetical protein
MWYRCILLAVVLVSLVSTNANALLCQNSPRSLSFSEEKLYQVRHRDLDILTDYNHETLKVSNRADFQNLPDDDFHFIIVNNTELYLIPTVRLKGVVIEPKDAPFETSNHRDLFRTITYRQRFSKSTSLIPTSAGQLKIEAGRIVRLQITSDFFELSQHDSDRGFEQIKIMDIIPLKELRNLALADPQRGLFLHKNFSDRRTKEKARLQSLVKQYDVLIGQVRFRFSSAKEALDFFEKKGLVENNNMFFYEWLVSEGYLRELSSEQIIDLLLVKATFSDVEKLVANMARSIRSL